MKSSNIGGQAVLEGIMMRSGSKYAVAVRKKSGEIKLFTEKLGDEGNQKWYKKVPFIRGVFQFADSMSLGIKTLTYSASLYEDVPSETKTTVSSEDESMQGDQSAETSAEFERLFRQVEKPVQKSQKNESNSDKILMAGSVVLALIIAVALFILLPYFLTSLMKPVIPQYWVRTVLEGFVRVGIFLLYIIVVSRLSDIRRTFMYHGAEHKCINCIEHGLPLNTDNVEKSSRLHKRCGTSFIVFIMAISIILFLFIRMENPFLRAGLRILLLPVIASISYEILKLAGSTENPIVNILSKPGLWIQRITTKEPDRDMMDVGIAAVEAVFDWRKYEIENFPETAEYLNQLSE
ncbi:MAG: DUF1385 domain-containing protein [Lachnospiraceae bacterium]|jgi:uncharacterized protein YqhQ|nr:DUF1385 domain-containing protein [Lachnospiraceae bacterium]